MNVRKRRKQRGIATIEFAFAFPVVLAVLVGVLEFGTAVFRRELLTSAVREAARAGVVATTPRPTVSDIQGVVRTYLTDAGLPPSTVNAISIPVTGAGGAAGQPLTVTGTYPTSFILLSRMPLGGGIAVDGSGNVTLSATATMQME